MTLIAQISDLHILPPGRLFDGKVDTNALAAQAVAALNALTPRPDAVIVTGDIIDTWNEADYPLARDTLARLEMPTFVLAGNHDDPLAMKRVFAGAPWAATPPERLYYTADIGPLRLIALDSWVEGENHGAVPDEQLAFLETELAAAGERPVVVAVHHPPFRIGIAGMDRLMMQNAADFEAVLKRHGNVVRLICGHCHRMVVTQFGGTVATIAPGTAHQIFLALDADQRFGFTLEPTGFLLHRWSAEDGMATHLGHIAPFPGPYIFQWEVDKEKGEG